MLWSRSGSAVEARGKSGDRDDGSIGKLGKGVLSSATERSNSASTYNGLTRRRR